MKIVGYNPGHDGAFVELQDGRLVASVEAEKDSNYRYTPLGSRELVDAFARLDGPPDVLAVGGWWPREARPTGVPAHVGYRGIHPSDILLEDRRLLGKSVRYFSSSHERSHLLCGYGMSPFPQGQPCYALVWEGAIGAFYEIDLDLGITLLADVMNQPGNRYASIYGLADPTFPKNAPFSRFSDAGKLMALASFSQRRTATPDEERVMDFLLSSRDVRLDLYQELDSSTYYNVGVEDVEFVGLYPTRMLTNVYFNPGDNGAAFSYGYRGSPCWVELGFDASAKFHTYGIDWRPGCISWLVDGSVVHQRASWDPTPIPHLPMRLHANVWVPRSRALAGQVDDRKLPSAAVFKDVGVTG